MKIGDRHWLVHRLMYTVFYGPIPAGMDVGHKCETRHCFNPDHLRLREHAGHARQHKRKLYCKNGHPRTRENVSIRKDGHLVCNACRRENWRKGRGREFEPVRRQRRLSDAEAQEVRDAYAKGDGSMRVIGERYGVGHQTISKIVRGRSHAERH